MTVTEQLAEAKNKITTMEGENTKLSESVSSSEKAIGKLTQEKEALAGEVSGLRAAEKVRIEAFEKQGKELSDAQAEVVKLKADAKSVDELAIEKLAKIGHPAIANADKGPAQDAEEVLKQYKAIQASKGQAAADAFYDQNRAILCPPAKQSRW